MITDHDGGSLLTLDPQQALPRHGSSARPQSTTSLVVGFDQDEASCAALRFAMDLGGRLQARLHVVHAINLCDFPVDPDGPDWEERGAQTLAEERAYVEGTLGAYQFGWSYQTCRGNPAAALAASAEEHDALLVVVGRHPVGATGSLHRLIAGSVSRRLPGRAGRPVLLVPAR